MKNIAKRLAGAMIGRLSRKQAERLFKFFLKTKPAIWIPLARQSLFTTKIPEFMPDLVIDRFSKEYLDGTYDILKNRFVDNQFFFVTDSDIFFKKDGIQQISPEIDISTLKIEKKPVFYCAFNSDEKLVGFLKKLKKIEGCVYYTPNVCYPPARYFHRNDTAHAVLLEDSQLEMWKFELADFENILQALEITRNLQGPYVEIGVYQGRSAHLALNYLSRRGLSKFSYLIDTYEGFSYSEARKSADVRWSDTHTDVSIGAVEEFLKDFPQKELIKMNVISEEIPSRLKDVSVCNIDVDMYEAVFSATTKMAPRMAKGGIMIIEDQGHTPFSAGAYLATVEFLESEAGHMFIPIHLYSGQMFLVKVFD